jgi:DNA-binding response OmpR family regulator
MDPFRYFEHVDLKQLPKSEPYWVRSSDDKRTFVLVVDDEHVIADTLVAILKTKGFSAFAAYDGNQGLEAARVLRPGVIITDIVLPHMNGVEMARRIRKFLPLTKVFLISGQATVLSLIEFGPAPKDFVVLPNPTYPSQLLQVLEKHLHPTQ